MWTRSPPLRDVVPKASGRKALGDRDQAAENWHRCRADPNDSADAVMHV